MQDPPIPNFYLVNLEIDPFLRILTGPYSFEARSWIKQKVLRIWLGGGGTFHKKYPNFDFWFSPGVHRNKKLHKTKCNQGLILEGVLFINKNWNSKSLVAPLAGRPSLPALFSLAVGQKSKFRFQHFICLILSFPKRYEATPLPPNPGRRYIWQKTHFFRLGLTPRA